MYFFLNLFTIKKNYDSVGLLDGSTNNDDTFFPLSLSLDNLLRHFTLWVVVIHILSKGLFNLLRFVSRRR